MAQQSIFTEFNIKMDVLENWSDLKNVSVLEQVSCLANCQQSSSFAEPWDGWTGTLPRQVAESTLRSVWEVLQGKIDQILIVSYARVMHSCVQTKHDYMCTYNHRIWNFCKRKYPHSTYLRAAAPAADPGRIGNQSNQIGKNEGRKSIKIMPKHSLM